MPPITPPAKPAAASAARPPPLTVGGWRTRPIQAL